LERLALDASLKCRLSMLAFACPVCERLVTFESTTCLNCSTPLGYYPSLQSMRPAAPISTGEHHARCVNADLAGCNWLVENERELCVSCVLTRTRPNDNDELGLGGLAAAEAAKRRLLFELNDLRLPLEGWHEKSGGLAFEMLSSEHGPVTTGHADGVITLDLDETDPARREQMRMRLGEPYRTVLGHFRHEIGHYYEPILIPDRTPVRARCRELFGDEREDYQDAMDRHYENGAPDGWERRFVSAYATMHPWEDFAETFAHYLHVRDTLQTAGAYGVRVDGPSIPTSDPAPLHATVDESEADIGEVLDKWMPMTYALNAISRSMGELDLYPFVLSGPVKSKLGFIDILIRQRDVASQCAG
jgi:hypothetical protein